jgi:hypothetical protein
MKKLYFYLFVKLIVYSSLIGQSKSNLDVVDSLIGLSVKSISNSISDNNSNFQIKFNLPKDYDVLSNSVIEKFQKNGINFIEQSNEKNDVINYQIENIKVEYPEMFRDGIFGEYLVNRKINLEGSYFINSLGNIGNVKQYKFNYSDTVAFNDINTLQNIAYSFTSPEIPSEPFFSSLVEPIIAIGTAAVAVYLFFNIRSK